MKQEVTMKKLVCILTVAALLLTAGCACSAGNDDPAGVTEGPDSSAKLEPIYAPVRADSLTPLSAKAATGEALLTVSKNLGGQETGLTWWIMLPHIAEDERASVEVTLTLPEGCTIDEAKCNGLLGTDDDVYTIDLSIWRPALTVTDGESSRKWVFRFLKEGES